METLFKTPTSVLRGLLAGHKINKAEAYKTLNISALTFDKKLKNPELLTLEELKNLATLFVLKEHTNKEGIVDEISIENNLIRERIVELTANIISKIKI